MSLAYITLDDLIARFGLDPSPFAQVAKRYPFRLTRYYAGLIKEPGDPIWRQCVPDPAELVDDEQLPDPLDEERLSPVPGLIHRYPDRAVLLVSNRCAVYCRFCMRKRQVGCGATSLDVDRAIDYIAATPQLRDVVLSGGDPLLLPLEALHDLLGRLRAIPHLDIIRIGSRAPVTAPGLITPELCRMLASHQPLYFNTHFNHPRELTTAAARACALLAEAGIPLGNQTVLLKGINDQQFVLHELFSGLLRLRVRPYYLHQMDLVQGTAHFRTPLRHGMQLMAGLRGQVSGMAIPHYVVDLPGGQGKVPLQAEAAQATAEGWLLRNLSGDQVMYRDPH
ncbi:KamA family radical SAM protein [Trichlorobacter sp.]|uniref:KamA family radical SAM protein n=1 Tax=Trichlorobacter sp. TaxID=2911007 RepID=UPI002A36FD0F|nr:KamA family radical SAM protein [Trichlorobacter sp.]MDY0384425.1 KamA family radical SAM protein [Trichlorobacter sp.]